jgi:hypothetical protein
VFRIPPSLITPRLVLATFEVVTSGAHREGGSTTPDRVSSVSLLTGFCVRSYFKYTVVDITQYLEVGTRREKDNGE